MLAAANESNANWTLHLRSSLELMRHCRPLDAMALSPALLP